MEGAMSQVRDLLRGYQVDLGAIQVCGNMTVVPIVSEQEFSGGVGEVDEVQMTADLDYGALEFTNQGGRVGIVMQGATIITKQNAQDRTVPQATILRPKSKETVGVFCVQQTQGGHIRSDKLKEEFGDEIPYIIMPPSLRSMALDTSYNRPHSYSNLWRGMEGYTGSYGSLRSTSHIVDLYKQYKDQLDTFVAQFEPVHNQLGAIVMIDQEVVAVDIMPTWRSWKKMWRTLIRDSYGAEAIRTAEQGQGIVWHYKLKEDQVTDLDSLEREMQATLGSLIAAIQQKWSEVDKEVTVQAIKKDIDGIHLVSVMSDRFIGQAVVHDEHYVYLSLIPKGSTRQKRDAMRRKSQTYSDEEFGF